jgi:hypothetical protein
MFQALAFCCRIYWKTQVSSPVTVLSRDHIILKTGRDYLEVLRVDERIILKWILNRA